MGFACLEGGTMRKGKGKKLYLKIAIRTEEVDLSHQEGPDREEGGEKSSRQSLPEENRDRVAI